jgi:predicted ATPase/Tfp pilus assembly protein PilF
LPPNAIQTSLGHLPVTLTPLIGREREEAAVVYLLHQPEVRLLTLTGPAGVGKTRLAAQAALDLRPEFAEGVGFVALALVREPALVLPTIAYSLGLREGTKQALVELLASYLQDKELLLVLDNLEQVITAAPELTALLVRCPKVKALVTSRSSLHVRGEQELPVPPLALPDPAHLPPLDDIAQYAAVALFVQRVRAVKPTFALNQRNMTIVAKICARLDGLPLAIELAAARSRVLSPESLLARLEQRMSLLTSGAQDLPERQRTLQNAINWSYDLLDVSEQQLFRRLGVFAGGWTLEAVEPICSGHEITTMGPGPITPDLDLLAALVDKSLVVEQTSDSAARYRLLETIREYALQRLETSGEADVIRRRHAEYYLALAERAELKGVQQVYWMHRLGIEYDNFHAVLTWARDQHEIVFGLRLCWELWLFWYMRGYLSQGRQWLQNFLSELDNHSVVTEEQDEETALAILRGKALHAAGTLAYGMGDLKQAETLLEEALTLRRMTGDPTSGSTLNNLGLIAEAQSDYKRARTLYMENLVIDRELGNTGGTAVTLLNLGNSLAQLGKHVEALAAYEETLPLFREAGDIDGVALALNNCGEIASSRGDFELAERQLGEALQLARSMETPLTVALILDNLGEVARHRGEIAVARSYLAESLKLRRAAGDQVGIASCLEGFAALCASVDQLERAAELYGTAAKLREALGVSVSPLHRAKYNQQIAAVRAKLGAHPFTAAEHGGRKEPLEQTLASLETFTL